MSLRSSLFLIRTIFFVSLFQLRLYFSKHNWSADCLCFFHIVPAEEFHSPRHCFQCPIFKDLKLNYVICKKILYAINNMLKNMFDFEFDLPSGPLFLTLVVLWEWTFFFSWSVSYLSLQQEWLGQSYWGYQDSILCYQYAPFLWVC